MPQSRTWCLWCALSPGSTAWYPAVSCSELCSSPVELSSGALSIPQCAQHPSGPNCAIAISPKEHLLLLPIPVPSTEPRPGGDGLVASPVSLTAHGCSSHVAQNTALFFVALILLSAFCSADPQPHAGWSSPSPARVLPCHHPAAALWVLTQDLGLCLLLWTAAANSMDRAGRWMCHGGLLLARLCQQLGTQPG